MLKVRSFLMFAWSCFCWRYLNSVLLVNFQGVSAIDFALATQRGGCRGNDGDAEAEVEFIPDGISTVTRVVVVGSTPGVCV